MMRRQDSEERRQSPRFQFGDDGMVRESPWRQRLAKAVRLIVVLALLAGAGLLAYDQRERIARTYAEWAAPSSPKASASKAGQTLYKWRDASGRTVYGDKPPPGVAATPIDGAVLERQNTIRGPGR